MKGGLKDVNITRTGEKWGIRVPWDETFTIYVWFDALLTYITGIGYGDDESEFNNWWPCDTHFIGKDITRFHCALWPAMLLAAGVEPPKQVFGHGFVYRKDDETGEVLKESKREPLAAHRADGDHHQVQRQAFRYCAGNARSSDRVLLEPAPGRFTTRVGE